MRPEDHRGCHLGRETEDRKVLDRDLLLREVLVVEGPHHASGPTGKCLRQTASLHFAVRSDHHHLAMQRQFGLRLTVNFELRETHGDLLLGWVESERSIRDEVPPSRWVYRLISSFELRQISCPTTDLREP